MKQMNEMSARALTMEELEFVNGGNSDQSEHADPLEALIGYFVKNFIEPGLDTIKVK